MMLNKKIIRDVGFTVAIALSSPVYANNSGTNPVSDPATSQHKSLVANVRSDFTDTVFTNWTDSDLQDLYPPVITWHNRPSYDKVKTDKYNDGPLGRGYGIAR